MYFLVKNIHPYSRQVQLKKLYKNGHLNANYLNKYMSHFIVHPEKLKQVIKEKDAHMLCQFFDSEEYKRRVTEFLEMQSRILSTNTFVGVKPSNIKYQHVLSCAQPSYQATKTLIDGNMKEESTPKEQNTRKKKFRKGTIFDQMLMSKANKEEFRTQITKSSSKRLPPKKVTHRTTIMPIFLKKIKNKPQHSINVQEYLDEDTILSENVKETLPESAKKHNFGLEVNREPMYAQILHRSSMYKKKNKKKYTDGQEKTVEVQKKLPKTQSVARNDKKTLSRYSPLKSEPVEVEERNVNQTFERNPPRLSNSNNPSTKISGATSKFQSPTLKLYPKKNMNLKSYSQLLLTEPVKCKTSKRERYRPFDLEGNQTKIKILKKKEPPPKKVITLMELVHDTQKNKRLEWEQGMEQKNAVKLAKRNAMKKSRYNDLELLSLFRQMKTIGEPKEQTEGKPNTKEDIVSRDIDLTDSKVPKSSTDKQSFTYKMVTKCRNNINSNLKQKFNINTPFWKKSLSETPFGQDALDLKMAIETSNMVSKNITECLHKPIPHFVQFAKRPSSKRMQQCFGFHKSAKLPSQKH
ncbi:uncharacterized protein LOC115882861 [Sitophilus oryzae]|uniref:Uncharacterized protein LOC115882861 n=1 Tax=Sitophilus oryzae TaxID=7048 RepID=A0A6J2Y127_SITOR|nr:uncharacterized protein LOC115882861 [Sitophilus oryzae]